MEPRKVPAHVIALIHLNHFQIWNGRPHRCLVGGCSGLVGEPTNDENIWADGHAPFYYHGRGRAVDFQFPDTVFEWIKKYTEERKKK